MEEGVLWENSLSKFEHDLSRDIKITDRLKTATKIVILIHMSHDFTRAEVLGAVFCGSGLYKLRPVALKTN